ncbi:MAG: carbohydrate kinase [Moorea sp. SIO2B7]|nr:carbohydrate kinase [Moorena sp. SIO2B7]
MSNPRVICLGEILFDCLADQLGRSLPEVESWTPYPGGAPANVACALVKLGTSAGFIGCVGEDKAGHELVTLLESVGVNSTGIQRHSSAPTRQVYVLRSETGDRSFAGFGDYSPDQFADAYLEASQLPSELFVYGEFLVLGTLELAYPQSRLAVFRALGLAEQYDVKVMLDLNWRPMFWQDTSEAKPLIKKLWKYVDFLKLSDEEAKWLFGTTDAGAIAHRLNSVEGVIVTAGAEDVSYCLSENEGKVSPLAVEVEDTTGAGDAFLAAFIDQLCCRGIASLKNPDIAKEMVTYACAVGGLTATKPGAIAAQPTALEVQAFLQ